MSIRYKLFIPLLFLMVAFILTIVAYWLPQYNADAQQQSRQHEQEELELLAISLIYPLRSGDLSLIHALLDEVQKTRPDWLRLQLLNADSQRLYPVSETPNTAIDDTIELQQKVIFYDTELATIKLLLDMAPVGEQIRKKASSLILLMLFLLVGAVIIAYLIQTLWILRPLTGLTRAAQMLGKGDYTADLPAVHNDEIGRVVTVFASMRESIRKLQQEQQQVSEARFRAVVETAHEAIITMDHLGHVLYWNKGAQQIFGYSKYEMLGRSISMLLPDDGGKFSDEDLFEAYIYELIGETLSINAIRKDGEEVPVELSLSSWHTKNDTFYSAIVRDVTERKQVEDALKDAYRHKSEFLSNMSHELRTPLNSIIGFSGALLKGIDGPINDEQTESLKLINKSGKHLLELINGVLDMSKLEAGKMELQLADVSLSEIIKEVAATLNILAREKGLSLEYTCADDIPVIEADPTKIKQILLNLVGNALKFTLRGGVQLRCYMTDNNDPAIPENIVQNMPDNTPYILVSVRDTGAGISKNDMTKLFEKFLQLDGASTRNHGGTGLGLVITQLLIKMHGGDIWLESVVDKGSTFYLILPAYANRPQVVTDLNE